MSKTNKTAHNKKAMIEALKKTLGVVTTACKETDISRTQFYHWLREDKEFKEEVEDIEDIAIDFVESQLFKRIQKGDTISTIFYLKTKAKKRGYIETRENVITQNILVDTPDED